MKLPQGSGPRIRFEQIARETAAAVAAARGVEAEVVVWGAASPVAMDLWLQERVAERVEARWRLFDGTDRLRTSVDGVRDAGAVEQTRAERAEDTLQKAIDGGLGDAVKRSDAMKAELSAQMVNIGHLEELQKKMDKVTAE